MSEFDFDTLQAGKTTKRFLVFAHDSYSQCGGLHDVILTTDDRDAVERLVRELTPDVAGGYGRGTFQVFDCDERRVVHIGHCAARVRFALERFNAKP